MIIMLGSTAFLLYYLYDLNTVFFHTRAVRCFFLIGSLLLAFATGGLCLHGWKQSVISKGTWIGLAAALFFLVLLVYTLFFALPADEAYQGKSDGAQKVCTTGMYALCRHPGVLWLAGMYMSLAAAFGGMILWLAAVIFTLLDVIYVILQDKVIFPRQFSDYDIYRQNTPFLIPDFESMRRAAATWKTGEK